MFFRGRTIRNRDWLKSGEGAGYTSVSYYLTLLRGPCKVKKCKIILEQSLLTGWVAGYLNCQPPFQFRQDFQTLLEWSDAHEGKTVCMSNRSTSTSVSDGPQSCGARELTY